jgi:hypothetical protein
VKAVEHRVLLSVDSGYERLVQRSQKGLRRADQERETENSDIGSRR